MIQLKIPERFLGNVRSGGLSFSIVHSRWTIDSVGAQPSHPKGSVAPRAGAEMRLVDEPVPILELLAPTQPSSRHGHEIDIGVDKSRKRCRIVTIPGVLPVRGKDVDVGSIRSIRARPVLKWIVAHADATGCSP